MPNPNPAPNPQNLITGSHPTGRVSIRQSASLTPDAYAALIKHLDAKAPARGAGRAGLKRSKAYGEVITAGLRALDAL